MFAKGVLMAAAVCLLAGTASGDKKISSPTHFRPISQSEYEAILSLTDGKPVVSEGRLIQGGLQALAGLASGWVTNFRFLNIFDNVNAEQKPPKDSYPLCVIKTSDLEDADHHDEQHHDEHHPHRRRRSDDREESSEDNYEHYIQQHYAAVAENENNSHEHEGSYEVTWHNNQHYAAVAANDKDSHEHGGSYEVTSHKNQLAHVVNCIVVLKEGEQYEHEVDHEHEHEDNHKHEHEHDHYHTTPKRPKRPRKKHRVHAPPPPEVHHSSAQLSAYPVHPPYGSYNNPWYWQSPHYNPYYSGPRAHTAIYPDAHPDIYAGNNPRTYPGAYPGAYLGNFAATTAGNNPYAYYNPYPSAYTGPASSAQPSIAYNSQPSSSAGHYPGVGIRQFDPASANSNAIYNTQPSEGGTAPVTKPEPLPASQAKQPTQINVNIAPLKSKKKFTGKVPLTTANTKTKQAINSNPKKERTVNQSYSTDASPLTQRHIKAKRDEANAQSHSYAKIASYSESGYQPTLYPQNSYPSNYPKVSYTHALPYPAPIYVRNSAEQPYASQKIKRLHANEADSEEGDNSTEFIQVRSNLRLALN